MGIIKQGILGGFSNKVGAVVGSSWKGIAVMKSKPISVANPRTTGQVNQRNKMRGLTQFLSPILASWIKPMVDRFAVRQSGFNRLTALNIGAMSDLGVPLLGSIVLSTGKLSTPILASVDVSGISQDIVLTWETTLFNQFDSPDDNLFIALFDQTQNKWLYVNSSATRSVGTNSFFPTEILVSGNIYFLYCAFRRSDGTYVGDNSVSSGLIA